MKHTLSGRSVNLDIIRCLALFMVNSVHFFLHTNYYNASIMGIRLYVTTLIRCASMSCVPLFLILSGYLMKNKQAGRQYYSKLIRILCIYFLANACCYIYYHKDSGTLSDYLLQTLNFSTPTYAWYINMYFGLFLMIPYLNILYNGVASEKSRRYLILTLLILTSFPQVFHALLYSYDTSQQLTLLPDWWTGIYPLTYYFLGAYLKDHPLKLTRKSNVLLLLLAVIINGTINYHISFGIPFLQGPWQEYGSVLNVIPSALLFNLLAGMEFKHIPQRAARLLSRMSDLSLGAFLVSLIFDEVIYDLLTQYQPIPALQLNWYPVTTVIVFTASLCLSWILDTAYSLAAAGLRSLLRRKQPA